jgi:DNA-binding transcriptional ArsR family regulator
LGTDHLSQVFAALADPTRRAILARLSKGEASVNEIAEPFDITLPAVSKHLKVLEKAGLIERTRSAQYRPCRLQAAPLRDASDWIDHYRQYWEESFDRLDAYLKTVTARQRNQKTKRGKKNDRNR